MTHCYADTYVERAAATTGFAAEVRAQKKVRKYALHGSGGYDFPPLAVESYGRQCNGVDTNKVARPLFLLYSEMNRPSSKLCVT